MLMKAEKKTSRMAVTPVIVLLVRDWMILRDSCCNAAGNGCREMRKNYEVEGPGNYYLSPLAW